MSPIVSEAASRQMRIKALYTYPIKSIRGCSSPTLAATPLGFKYDRRFMLQRVEDSKNMHVSEFTEMCLFTTTLTHEATSATPVRASNGATHDRSHATRIEVRYGLDHVFEQPDKKLTPLSDIKSDGHDVDRKVLYIPAQPDVNVLQLKEVEVVMHSSPTTAYDMGADFNNWFSRRFGYQVRLLYVATNQRPVLGNVKPSYIAQQPGTTSSKRDPAAAGSGWFNGLRANVASTLSAVTGGTYEQDSGWARPGWNATDSGIGFADCAPFLVVNTKSWENANSRLPDTEEMDISKFRPNIVVEGLDEFEEDYWAELHVYSTAPVADSDGLAAENRGNGVRIVLTANCARCNSLNVDYSTGKVSTSEAGKILKKLQKDRRVDLGAKYSPVFGRYGFLAFSQQGESIDGSDQVDICVGDTVEVVRRNAERTRFQWPNLSTDK